MTNLLIKDLTLKLNGKDISLDSFLVSKTSYDDLIRGMNNPPSKEEYIENHVLFLSEKDWVEKLFLYIYE